MRLTQTILPFAFTLLAGACGAHTEEATDDTSAELDLEMATQVAALEVNEDGSDIEGADATEDEPLLLRRCGFGPVRRHLVARFDEDGDGNVTGDERQAMADAFGVGGDIERPLRPEGDRPLPDAERPARPDGDAGAFEPPPVRPNGTDAGALEPPPRPARGERPPPHVGRHHRLRLLHELYDVDGSGDLDEAERAALEADLTARCEHRMDRLLAAFDSDGNGELDDDEWEDAHAAIRERFAARHADVLAEFDADGDGMLDPEEHRAAAEARIARLEAEREALREAFDTNGDGALDDEERAALREALKARLRGEAG